MTRGGSADSPFEGDERPRDRRSAGSHAIDRRRRAVAGSAAAVLVLAGSGCLSAVENALLGETKRALLEDYERGAELFDRAYREVDEATDAIDRDDWETAKARLESARPVARDSAEAFGAAYSHALDLPNTRVQRLVASAWTKARELAAFARAAIRAAEYGIDGDRENAEYLMKSEAKSEWEAVQEARVAPPDEVREALDL